MYTEDIIASATYEGRQSVKGLCCSTRTDLTRNMWLLCLAPTSAQVGLDPLHYWFPLQLVECLHGHVHA